VPLPYDVTVVGSLNMDLVVYADELPRRGETRLAERFVMVPGGKGLNQAVAAARQGARTALVGVVGTDDLGDQLLAVARDEGVAVEHLRRDEATGSGVALITVDAEGDNTILVAPQANARLGEDDVTRAGDALTATRVVLTQLETPPGSVRAALRQGRAAGATTILNPAPAPAQTLDADLLALCDLVVPNESEAAAITGHDTSDDAGVRRAARALLDAGAGAVVVTLGDRGSFYCDARRSFAVPTFPVAAVDTTAAGDAFCGALAARLAARAPLDDALRHAAAAGALAVTVAGATPALPTAAAVRALLGA
jgi:ribokinase